MITETTAKEFATHWLRAFNSHNIEAIMQHYAEDVQFYSPFIILLQFNTTGIITGKHQLQQYFQIGLNTYPMLQFTLHHYFTGINSIVLHYTSVNNRLAAETFIINNHGKATTVFCNYNTQTATTIL